MTTQNTATLTLQKWGNSLALRIPSNLAKKAHFHIGTQVELALEGDQIHIKSVGEHQLSLAERLELFDPKKHGGEAMKTDLVGLEKF